MYYQPARDNIVGSRFKPKGEIMKSTWFGKNFVSVDSLSLDALDELFDKADKMKSLVEEKGGNNALSGRVMAALFYEPSSRTFGSFVAAMQRLGGSVIPFAGMSSSAVAKGETLADTAKVFSSYADVIVMRNPEVGSVDTLAKNATVPVISAGDGIGEHPTQALLDAYTVRAEFGSFDNLHIVIVGELAHYRPVNSLAKLLALYPKVKISFVAFPEFALQPEVREYLVSKNVNFSEHIDLDEVLGDADVLYVTRPKKEFLSEELYKKALGKYVITAKTLSKMKKTSIIMHPLPRIDEIAVEVDSDPRAVYLTKQMKNGVYVRMALLDLVING
jgi:aspartate carbamoyltransferase